ncbi:hypothetical protein [Pyrococcus horikoshii]|uniref:Bacterial Pleckstrin homology domain-containing protein n=2 Tax=Pyrococcus horikoshii TaxID=53953 RepID=O59083_PYRHO|nr:hypothetical protein [Pyrococcus horikoshii]BAA30464.1 148aa long hypothetical protein [Pyrococcus horikoshii OT3]HII60361.1 hypothetical protein [Pyrococcus horikoshii]
MLYEEVVSSRLLNLILGIVLLPILVLMIALRNQPEALKILGIEALVVSIILMDASAIKITIDEESIRIRGRLGILLRKTVRIEEIEGYSIGKHWMSCQSRGAILHFTVPAKGCILLKRRKGITVSFSTNNPEEVGNILSMLGVPKIIL